MHPAFSGHLRIFGLGMSIIHMGCCIEYVSDLGKNVMIITPLGAEVSFIILSIEIER